VYDHEQPAAGADVSAVVALAPRAWVGTAMIWRADCRHDLVAVGSQLSVLVEDVLPAFVIENHGASVRSIVSARALKDSPPLGLGRQDRGSVPGSLARAEATAA
jgi:hypothetical protein